MWIGLVFSIILFIPLVYGSSLDKSERKTNTSLPVVNNILHESVNKTKIIVASEGGTITSNTPALSLPNDDAAISMTENVMSSNKVKARKGAFLNPAEDSKDLSSIDSNKSEHNGNHPSENTKTSMKYNVSMNTTTTTTKMPKNSSPFSSVTNTTRVHKPMIVSVEALAKMDEINNDQLDDDIYERNIKIQKLNSNGHPGMVMPVVITILVVPMFAVIGYIVVKRGQEAWKNRHYKRMDFLLDGMYND